MQQSFTHARPFDNTAPAWRIASNETDHGTLIRLDGPNGTAALFNSTAAVDDIPALRKLAASIESAAAKIAEIVSDTIPAKIPEKIAPVIRSLGASFRDARVAVVKRAEEIALANATATQLPASYDPTLAQHAINQWSGLKHGERLQAVSDWPDYAVQAVARLGQQMTGLSPDEFQAVEMRIRVFNLRSRVNAENPNFAIQPNAENPIARGLDESKINAFIEDQTRIHELRLTSIKQAEDMLRNVVIFVSVALGKPVAEAWEILQGTKDA